MADTPSTRSKTKTNIQHQKGLVKEIVVLSIFVNEVTKVQNLFFYIFQGSCKEFYNKPLILIKTFQRF